MWPFHKKQMDDRKRRQTRVMATERAARESSADDVPSRALYSSSYDNNPSLYDNSASQCDAPSSSGDPGGDSGGSSGGDCGGGGDGGGGGGGGD